MFPTLKEMCHQLDQKLGFNVEIKYPIDLEVKNFFFWTIHNLLNFLRLNLGRIPRNRLSHKMAQP